jgi:hypothetical protein
MSQSVPGIPRDPLIGPVPGWVRFISPKFISSTVHLVDSHFADSSFRRQFILPTVRFADSSFCRQYVLPTVRFADNYFADSHFADNTFH